MQSRQDAAIVTKALAELIEHTGFEVHPVLSTRDEVPASTYYHRKNGRKTRAQKAQQQQYLTPAEEKALAAYLLQACISGNPRTPKDLRSIAYTIRRQRSSRFQALAADEELKPPNKNWPQGFYKRHPEITARRVKALDWSRHDKHIYEKVTEWFDLIGKQLDAPDIVPENVYNMDETGVLLSSLASLKVLVGKDDMRDYRGAGVKRTLITAIECISADGRYLFPLIIWPAVTHRSNWTTHPTPGWHFACSSTGYTDSQISLYWLQRVFDPHTKARAGKKPRVLIWDGFGTHESLEVLKFCYENNIVLCRLPSHTSHKLQPCDVGVFGPLKTAYREQVERLYRGGANTIGKEHFTTLYSRAREVAFTPRNIRGAWKGAGLYPLRPDRVLQDMQKPRVAQTEPLKIDKVATSTSQDGPVRTPVTPVTMDALLSLRQRVEKSARAAEGPSAVLVQKLANAAELAFAERNLLFNDNRVLLDQNNESRTRQSVKNTIVGRAKMMEYADIVAAQEKRDKAEAQSKGGRGGKRKQKTPSLVAESSGSAQSKELEQGEREIETSGLKGYCSILRFE